VPIGQIIKSITFLLKYFTTYIAQKLKINHIANEFIDNAEAWQDFQ